MWILSLLVLAAMIFAVVDIVVRDQSEIKHLPKVAWLFLVVFLPLVGTVLWFLLGREYPERAARAVHRPAASAPRSSEPASVSRSRHDIRSTEQQLADLEREIEEDRLRAEVARKRAERDGRTDA